VSYTTFCFDIINKKLTYTIDLNTNICYVKESIGYRIDKTDLGQDANESKNQILKLRKILPYVNFRKDFSEKLINNNLHDSSFNKIRNNLEIEFNGVINSHGTELSLISSNTADMDNKSKNSNNYNIADYDNGNTNINESGVVNRNRITNNERKIIFNNLNIIFDFDGFDMKEFELTKGNYYIKNFALENKEKAELLDTHMNSLSLNSTNNNQTNNYTTDNSNNTDYYTETNNETDILSNNSNTSNNDNNIIPIQNTSFFIIKNNNQSAEIKSNSSQNAFGDSDFSDQLRLYELIIASENTKIKFIENQIIHLLYEYEIPNFLDSQKNFKNKAIDHLESEKNKNSSKNNFDLHTKTSNNSSFTAASAKKDSWEFFEFYKDLSRNFTVFPNVVFGYVFAINENQLGNGNAGKNNKNNTSSKGNKDANNDEAPFEEIKIFIENVDKELSYENILLPQFTDFDLYQGLYANTNNNKNILNDVILNSTNSQRGSTNNADHYVKRESLIQKIENYENKRNYLIKIKGRNIVDTEEKKDQKEIKEGNFF